MKKKIKNIYFSIAVDGSSASGKTTGSKFIARKFGFKLLSSGKLYRYLALKILKNKGKYNIEFINKVSKSITVKKLKSKNLYNTKVTELSSIIAKKKIIRQALKKFQIQFIKKNKKVICEGRDIATKIHPKADLKLFFKCSIREKAKRRLKEFRKINKKITLKEVEKALIHRDLLDTTRKISPLRFVKSAVLVDTTILSMKQMEVKLKKIVSKAIQKKYGNL